MRIGPVGSSDELTRSEGFRSNVVVEKTQRLEPDLQETGKNLEDIQRAVDSMKKKLEKLKEIIRGEAEFEIDRKTGMVIVKIKDRNTGEIIRQIPPEVVVKIAKVIEEFLGLLLDERV